jgi:hypothetical protein
VEAITCNSAAPDEYRVEAPLTAGNRTIGISFVNDAFGPGSYDRNFFLHGLRLARVR